MEKSNVKYPIKIIDKYVRSKELLSYDIEKLEDDFDFMTQVISFSDDINFYYLCSERLKLNSEFIYFLLYKFPSNDEFIWNAIGYYIDKKKENDLLEVFETLLHVESIFSVSKSSKLHDCRKLIYEMYSNQMNKFEKDQNYCGFLSIIKELGKSEIVTDFFAKNFIIDYIGDGEDLEERIHNQFDSSTDFRESSDSRFALEYLSEYDFSLSNYAFSHPQVLLPFSNKVNLICSNWRNHENEKKKAKYNTLFDRIDGFVRTTANNGIILFNSYMFIKRLSTDLNDEDLLKEYENLVGSDAFDVLKKYDMSDGFKKSEEILNSFDSAYSHIGEIACEIFDLQEESFPIKKIGSV